LKLDFADIRRPLLSAPLQIHACLESHGIYLPMRPMQTRARGSYPVWSFEKHASGVWPMAGLFFNAKRATMPTSALTVDATCHALMKAFELSLTRS
jgi:hypothetical protein